MIEKIETLSARAIPCRDSILLDGWELRFANGLTRRTNSVNVVARGTQNIPLGEKIRQCERTYSDRGRPCHFRITPPAMEIGLDAALAERGYDIFDPTGIRLLDLKGRHFEQDSSVQLYAHENDSWLRDVAILTGQAPQQKQTFADMMSRIAGRKICAHIRLNGQTAACALGVVEQGMTGIFEVATAKSARRQGIAKTLIASLLEEAISMGAETAYLQVVHDNRAGNRFWDSVGFSNPLYGYHYRSKPV